MLRRYLVVSLTLMVVSSTFLEARTVLDADRVTGVIMGAALGDALARVTMPFETAREIKLEYGDEGITSVSKFAENDWILVGDAKRAPYASNTVLSILALDVLAEARHERKSKEDIAESIADGIVRIFGDGHQVWDPHFDARYHTSPNLEKAEDLVELAKSKKGSPWWARQADDVAREGDSGALMRAWPAGVVYNDHMTSANYYTDYLTTMTNRHPAARAAASAIVTGLAHALQGASVDDIVKQMVLAAEKFDRLERAEKKDAEKIWGLRNFTTDILAEDRMLNSDMIRYAAQAAQDGVTPEEMFGTNNKRQDNNRSFRGHLLGYQADEAVAAVAYLMVRNPESFKGIVAEGSMAVGNSALITSLAGAFYGARHGYAQLNEEGYADDIAVLENKEVLETLAAKAHESLSHPGKLYEYELEDDVSSYYSSSSFFSFKRLLLVGGMLLGGYLVKKYVVPYVSPRVRVWFK